MADARPDVARRSVLAAIGFALLLPTVIFLQIPDTVIFANVEELLYSERLTAIRAGLLLVSALILFVVLLRFRREGSGAALVRVVLFLAAVLIVNNITYSTVSDDEVSLGISILIDATVFVVLALAVRRMPLELSFRIGAAMGAVLLVVGIFNHQAKLSDVPENQRRGALSDDPGPVAEPELAAGTQAQAKPRGNVYHLVLDGFHGSTWPTLKEMSGYETLDSYNHYANYTSPSTLTSSSLPFSMQGKLFEEGEDWAATIERDAYEKGLWGRLAAAGMDVNTYSFRPEYCFDFVAECQGPAQLEEGVLDRATVDLSFLRIIPGSAAKGLDEGTTPEGDEATEQNETDFGFSLTSMFSGDGGVFRTRRDGNADESAFSLLAFDKMIEEEAGRPEKGQYVFWHGLMPHDPFLYSSECEYVRDKLGPDSIGYQNHGLCALKLIKRLTDRLDELGRLDDATIVVHSDHGFIFSARAATKSLAKLGPDLRPTEELLGPPFPGYEPGQDLPEISNDELYEVDPGSWESEDIATRTNALLLVRGPEGRPPPQTDKPVQGIDIAPIVLDAVGLGHEGMDGLALGEIAEAPERTPVMLNTRHEDARQPPEFARYERRRDGNWVLDGVFPTGL